MSETRAALARTYRPRRFDEITAQDHVAGTLKAAVARGRAAHAYLFCGPRGVGKTTAARVLAMALNCPVRGEDGEPCGVCDSCERIWGGRTSLDVVEIDAASNRGVDDARDLRERAMYAPTDDERFKVYIIDEAHMLTREAWNALLKILEEPPPRVIFVFATTEPQKIQQTAAPILSRCQRFDFRRVGVPEIVERLRHVLAEEHVEADADALTPIARRADGGMRDALSLLDQVLSFSSDRVTADDVRRMLGLVADELYLELFEIIAGHRYGDVFRFVQRILDQGYDLNEFYRGLADALRLLLTIRFDGAEGAEVRDDLRDTFAELADRFGTGDLLRMLTLVAELDTEGRFRKSGSPRTMLEALLLRFAYLDRTVDVEAVLSAVGGDAGGGGRPVRRPDPPTPPPERRPPSPRAPTQRTSDDAPKGRTVTAPTDPPAGRRLTGTIPSASGGSFAARAEGALATLLAHRESLPGGLGIFLRTATVAEATADHVVLEMPPGPGLEQLSGEVVVRQALQNALGEQLAHSITLEVRQVGGRVATGRKATPERLTPEKVRGDRLARLARDAPVLARAVEAWDLDLLD